jgi:hypothetical protein
VLRTRRTLEYGSLTVLAFEPNCTQAGKPDLKRASVTVVIVRPEAERLWITGASERTGNTLILVSRLFREKSYNSYCFLVSGTVLS